MEQTRALIYLYTYLVHHVVGFPGPFANKRLDEMIEMNLWAVAFSCPNKLDSTRGPQRFGPHCNADQKEKKTASFSYVIGAQKFLRNHACECQTDQFMEMFSSPALLAELSLSKRHLNTSSFSRYLG